MVVQVQEAALREAQIRDGEAQLQISKLTASASSLEQKLAVATAELEEERARRGKLEHEQGHTLTMLKNMVDADGALQAQIKAVEQTNEDLVCQHERERAHKDGTVTTVCLTVPWQYCCAHAHRYQPVCCAHAHMRTHTHAHAHTHTHVVRLTLSCGMWHQKQLSASPFSYTKLRQRARSWGRPGKR